MYGRRIGRGYVEQTAIDGQAFEEQYQSFQRSGFALDSSSQAVLGDYQRYLCEQAAAVLPTGHVEKEKEKERKGKDKKRKVLELLAAYGSDEDEDDNGPWAPLKESKTDLLLQPPVTLESTTTAATVTGTAGKTETERETERDELLTDSHKAVEEQQEQQQGEEEAVTHDPSVHIHEPDEESEKWEKVAERKLKFVMPPRPARGAAVPAATTSFHGEALVDFQGRPWSATPKGLRGDEGEHECYIPKACVKRLAGHSKGVQAIEFIPTTGHLLLSASLDGKCKIWDSHRGDFSLQRTYSGHTEAVRSIQFSNDGAQFLSSGYDRLIRLWDTESGKALSTFSNRKMAYCVRYYPKDNHLFLAASSDNRIYQWDTRTGDVVQEYNYHLQACNTVAFVDDGNKFVSTSDDKKVLVWEFGIPVPIKYIQEPDLHSIPSITLHPKESFFAGQSMDNQIVVYTAGEKVRQIKKRSFKGHNNSGYACQVGFSPNGKFIMSGDGLGQLVFWDWRSAKIYRKFHAHENGPCMGAVWHPLHPSRVATCGWDGLVKIWE